VDAVFYDVLGARSVRPPSLPTRSELERLIGEVSQPH